MQAQSTADSLEAVSACVARGDHTSALALLSAAIEREPQTARYWAYRGRLCRLTGRPRDALDDLRHAARLDPRDPYPRAQIAWALWALGERSAAKRQLRDLRRRFPSYHWGHAFIAQQYLVSGQLQAGLRAARRARELDPTCVYSARIMADLLANVGALDDAIELFEAVIAATPQDPFPHAECGLARGLAGDYDRAVIDLDHAVELAPHVRHFWRDRAALHILRGDHEAALRDCRRAVEVSNEAEPHLAARARQLRHQMSAARAPRPRWTRRSLLGRVGVMAQSGEPLA